MAASGGMRIAELKAVRDQARADAERAQETIDRAGPIVTAQALTRFARTARKRMRTDSGGYRRDRLRALAQRVEVDAKEIRIMGSKSALLRTLVAASSAKTAGFGVPSLYRSGAPEGIRTPDPQIRSLVLYPAELPALRLPVAHSRARAKPAVAGRRNSLPRHAPAGGHGDGLVVEWVVEIRRAFVGAR